MTRKSCLLIVLISLVSINRAVADCSMLNFCNGHGVCHNKNSTCECFEGWGNPKEIATYIAPDCTQRTCPTGPAWGNIPTSATAAHGVAECSNMGHCDRTTGMCRCLKGFTGKACERKGCPMENGVECSGHGRCVSMRQFAKESNGYPVSQNTLYQPAANGNAWDADRIYGCVCDSTWTVGLGDGETQEPEWFGPDCSKRHCPSGEDPKRSTVGAPKNREYLDCGQTQGYWAQGIGKPGHPGNLCQVDCSNRGVCDYSTGVCTCYRGFYGSNCGIYSPDGQYHFRGETTTYTVQPTSEPSGQPSGQPTSTPT